MNNQRFILIGGLVLIMMLIYQQWQVDYNPSYRQNQEANQNTTNVIDSNGVSQTVENKNSDLPVAVPSNITSEIKAESPHSVGSSQIVTVETDLLKLKIDSVGGTIKFSELLKYPKTLDENSPNVKLFNIDADNYYIAQSGLRSSNNVDLPNHYSQFSIESTHYKLSDGQDEIQVPFTWTNAQGIKVIKTFVIKRDSYEVKINYKIVNPLDSNIDVALYQQIQKRYKEDEGSKLLYTYSGGVIFDDVDKYQKIEYSDFKEFNSKTVDAGWLALIQHYFVTAWIPDQEQKNNFYTKELIKNNAYVYLIGTISPIKTVAAQTTKHISGPILYVGPKEQHRLGHINGLKLVVDYGILTIIADPLFWLLNWFYQYLGNWGWSIIMVTVVIKAAFYWLSKKSYISMARMRKLQPKIEKLKERFGDDRQKMGMAQMELFKKEKVNPLGGCLPIFVQMPVFIGLYWMLMESVEIRQAPWILWINDLSVADPYFILPLIMGVTMFVQQRLNPAPVDPIQKKVFMFLPFVFTVFFAFFPAGLVLYWVVNNLLSITQQYYITRQILNEK